MHIDNQSARRNIANTAQGGVGVLVTNKVEKLISSIKLHTNRILQLDISGNPNTSLIINYSPVNGDDDAEDHYQRFCDITNALPNHNMKLNLGDFKITLKKVVANWINMFQKV